MLWLVWEPVPFNPPPPGTCSSCRSHTPVFCTMRLLEVVQACCMYTAGRSGCCMYTAGRSGCCMYTAGRSGMLYVHCRSFRLLYTAGRLGMLYVHCRSFRHAVCTLQVVQAAVHCRSFRLPKRFFPSPPPPPPRPPPPHPPELTPEVFMLQEYAQLLCGHADAMWSCCCYVIMLIMCGHAVVWSS